MVSRDDFRAGMGAWATGVTIVTARDGDHVHGMTVSDFSGVSLSPPLVLVCADKTSLTHGVIAAGGCFAVNVLAADQENLSNLFASKADEFRRFEGLETRVGTTGAPLLAGAVATFDCSLVSTHEAGDHDIYVGRVEELSIEDREPLVYYRGRYDGLASALSGSGAG